MSTCNNKLLESRINEIHKKKTINIICKDWKGNTIFVDTLKYDKSLNYPEDVLNRIIEERMLDSPCLFADYDDNNKAKYIVTNARKNNSIIDWNINFGSVKILDIFRINGTNVVNINISELGDMGSASGTWFTAISAGIIANYITKAFDKLNNFINATRKPYTVFIKEMELYYDKEFIKKVICLNKSWPVGFITNKNILNKKTIENRIMKKLGYRKKSNIWIKKDDVDEDDFSLYSKEDFIVGKCNKILRNYKANNKQKQKKLHELFHLLTFLDISGIKYRTIKPNEPGDFLVNIKGKKIMIEVVTCFEEGESGRLMKENIIKVFNFNRNINEIEFNIEKMKENFIKNLNSKQNTKYNFKNKILLIATAEYDNCPVTGDWFLKKFGKELLNNIDNFDEIWTINYFASGKDNGPCVTTNLKLELEEYKNLLNNN